MTMAIVLSSAPEQPSVTPDIARVAPREVPKRDRVRVGMTLDQVQELLGDRYSFMGSHHSLLLSWHGDDTNIHISLVDGKVESITKRPQLLKPPKR